jgi:hypothetical protein
MTEQKKSRNKKPPKSRTGIPVKAVDDRRKVFLHCEHGWVKEPLAKENEWIWCDKCADWCQVQKILEIETS